MHTLGILNRLQRYVVKQSLVNSIHTRTHTHKHRLTPQSECISNCYVFALQNVDFLQGYTGYSTEVKFTSFIQVNYDKEKYVLNSQKQKVHFSLNTVRHSIDFAIKAITTPNLSYLYTAEYRFL